MHPSLVILSALFFTSGILCVTMTVAWLHFGRERHIFYWALCYGISMFQWLFNAGGIMWENPALRGAAGICVVISSSLVAIGARQRSGRRVHWRRFAAGGALAAAGVLFAHTPLGTPMLRGTITTFYAAVMLATAALAIWPRSRRFTAPERAFFVVLILFTVFQLVLAGIGTAFQPGPLNAALNLHRTILGMGLPAIYMATGVSAVLVIADDLATQLRKLVSHDELTDLLNRRGLEEAGARAIANARRHDRLLALVICDLDSFKAVNDNFGHIAGDETLRAFAAVLLGALRKGDMVGRLGGDEFCALLPEATAQDAADVMERVRIGLRAIDHIPGAGIRASFGIAALGAGDTTLDDLFLRADRALYESKQHGRDRVTVWNPATAQEGVQEAGQAIIA